ncbi:MAG TPA: YetF domain-containing protein [Gemmatimonadales bacterium]|nr:YetF domain-containing protein [Gemmatimonadales bacterium]
MPTFWHDLLVPGVSLEEKIIRPILIYLFLVVGLRLAGKRELAQLNPFDLVVLLTLSNTVQNAIIGDDNSVLGGIVGATTLLVINYMVVMLAYRNHKLGALIEGAPDVLVMRGRVLAHRLEREKITLEELEAGARKQGFASLKDVDQAILYPGGTFCFIGRVPSADAVHHSQIMRELHDLKLELAALKGR